MEIALSDLLTCPRCGPAHGLVLLPAEVRDRRVVSGVLGCPNCRERYPVERGVADLRGGAGPVAEGPGDERTMAGRTMAGRTVADADPQGGDRSGPSGSDGEAAVRLAALLGLSEAGGVVLIAGPAAVHGARVAEVASGTTVVTTAESGPVPGVVSRLRIGVTLPLRTGSLRGVALTGSRAQLLEEGARLLAPAGRLVLDPAPADAGGRVAAAGLRTLAEEGRMLVAGRHR